MHPTKDTPFAPVDYSDPLGDDDPSVWSNAQALVPHDELSLLASLNVRYQVLARITDPVAAISERDMGMALKECLERKGASLEAQNAVGAYTVWSEYTAAKLYEAMPKDTGGRPKKTGTTVVPVLIPTIADLGIKPAEAMRLKLVAELEEEDITDYIETTKAKAGGEVSLAGPRKLGKAKRRAKKRADHEAQAQAAPTKPRLWRASWDAWLPVQPDCDLLFTDPPYSTDVDDIEAFAAEWLPLALSAIRPTGRAYVCIGAYPEELRAYLNADRAGMTLAQVLVWSYRNTKGPKPKLDYQLNWQAILYFRGPDAPPLDCPELNEQEAVQAINAPDGRIGDRYHAWQKPDELAERLIRHSTKPGDMVLDPFAGTGTFILAATRLGREGRGCDVDESMIAIAVQRGCGIEP